MDRFVKIKRQTSSLSGFVGDVTTFNAIATMIDENGMICVYGPSGCGKTFMVHLALKNENWIEIHTAKDIPETLCESTCHVVIDSDKIDKSILDMKGKLSLGSTIFITKTIENIDFCDCIRVTRPSVDTLIEIGKKVFPKIDGREAALNSDGDIRSFLFNIQFSHDRDIFKTSKEYIHDLLCSDINIANEVNKEVSDHGYIWDIVYSNYIECGLNHNIAESLSLADIYDTRVYNNSWEMLDYFWISGVIYPLSNMKRPLNKNKLKPGISWTKFSNYKMRSKKLQSMPPNDTCRMLLFMMKTRPYEEALELLRSYNIKPKDIDVLNLLSLDTKIPVKQVKRFKSDLAAGS